MLQFIILCFSTSFVILLVYDQLFGDEGYLSPYTHRVDLILFKLRILWISKPLYSCMICMSSVWGSAIFSLLALIMGFELSLLKVAGAVPVIGGMVALISTVYFGFKSLADDVETGA